MSPLQQLLIAAGLGLLVGLQRERVHKELAGIRTFPLITVFGALSGLAAQRFGGWVTVRKIFDSIARDGSQTRDTIESAGQPDVVFRPAHRRGIGQNRLRHPALVQYR